MNIFIDESGSFVSALRKGSWNAVAAFALPEASRKGLEQLVSRLKAISGRVGEREVKLSELDESDYLVFLTKLARLHGALFCIATDAGVNTVDSIAEHQRIQVVMLRAPYDKMRFEGGRQHVAKLAAQIEKLSPQLYVQMFCQIELMYDVVSRAITYYAQRNPSTLSEFRWRVDQKGPNFEDAFEKLSPTLLQTMSLSQPLLKVKGFDYSRMEKYEFGPGEAPTYLEDHYGIKQCGDSVFNIGKLIRGDIKFMDSKDSVGIQAVDLVVSGIRKCLRKGFGNNELVAAHLGRLMVQATYNA